MRSPRFLLCLLAGIFSAQTFAGVGQTSSGVTTTVGNQNDPSAEVQQQSSGFVQQNQQLANTQPNPGAVASAPGAGATQGGQAGAAAGAQNKANGGSVNGVPVPVPVAVPAPAPATPPPPPPTYESTMRRLDRHNEATPTVIASGPPGAVRKQDPAEPPKLPRPTPAPAPAVSTPANTVAAGRAETAQAPSERVVPPAIAGGRGEAPDGFTFYSGVSIAGALLAFAFATFLRMGRSET